MHFAAVGQRPHIQPLRALRLQQAVVGQALCAELAVPISRKLPTVSELMSTDLQITSSGQGALPVCIATQRQPHITLRRQTAFAAAQ
ncbi:hypothetical protein D3C84_1046950 [compost metagenome]